MILAIYGSALTKRPPAQSFFVWFPSTLFLSPLYPCLPRGNFLRSQPTNDITKRGNRVLALVLYSMWKLTVPTELAGGLRAEGKAKYYIRCVQGSKIDFINESNKTEW
jgi:hypothetical protein